jgi:hypothetical protein
LKHLGQAVKIDDPLTYYRVHEDSMIRSREHAAWYDELAAVTHHLADHLSEMTAQPPSWTDASNLRGASHIYRTTARYDEMEAALLRGQYFLALRKCAGMLQSALTTPGGINRWHLKLAARCLQGRAIERQH